MNTPDGKRVDAGSVTLAWGDAARWKAQMREERMREWAARPLDERLLAALRMVRRRGDDRATR